MPTIRQGVVPTGLDYNILIFQIISKLKRSCPLDSTRLKEGIFAPVVVHEAPSCLWSLPWNESVKKWRPHDQKIQNGSFVENKKEIKNILIIPDLIGHKSPPSIGTGYPNLPLAGHGLGAQNPSLRHLTRSRNLCLIDRNPCFSYS